jgi:hypothetical protein
MHPVGENIKLKRRARFRRSERLHHVQQTVKAQIEELLFGIALQSEIFLAGDTPGINNLLWNMILFTQSVC